jgi:flavoprotein
MAFYLLKTTFVNLQLFQIQFLSVNLRPKVIDTIDARALPTASVWSLVDLADLRGLDKTLFCSTSKNPFSQLSSALRLDVEVQNVDLQNVEKISKSSDPAR